jgi:hypothetical protein
MLYYNILYLIKNIKNQQINHLLSKPPNFYTKHCELNNNDSVSNDKHLKIQLILVYNAI